MSGSITNTAGGTVADPTLWGAVLSLHVLGMAIWIGGAAFVLYGLKPSLALLDNTQRVSVQLQSLKKFFFLVWHAMPVMLITGWLMLAFPMGGFGDPDWHIQAMQGLGVVMAAIFLFTFFGPYKRARRALRPQPAVFDRIRSLLTLNLFLGAITVVIAALDHFNW